MTDRLVFRLTPEAQAAGLQLPTKAYASDAAWDLPTLALDYDWTDDYGFLPIRTYRVRTGIIAEIPAGWFGQLAIRSGVAEKVFLSGGVIDSGYTGEIKAFVNSMYGGIPKNMLQLLILPIYPMLAYDADGNLIMPRKTGVRGDNGFGSTNE